MQKRSCLGLMLGLFISISAHAEELTIYTENAPPINYIDKDGKVTGSAAEIVQEIQRRIHSSDVISVLPWKRAYREATEKSNVALFSTTFTEQRRNLFKWVGPVAQISWVLYARADSDVVINGLEDAKKVDSIGTYLADVREQFLKSEGFTNIQSTTDTSQNLRKLLKGRITLWFSSNLGARELTKEEGISFDQIKPVYTVKSTGLYIVFNKETPDATVGKWQQAYEEIKNDGTLKRISEKWNHPYPDYVIPPPSPDAAVVKN